MNTKDFLKILKVPAQLQSEQILDIENVIHSFPYFQAARVLYLKGLKNQNSFRYNNSLKTTAIHTTNRSVLFHFITSDTFHDSFSKNQESKIIEKIESIDKTVIENLNKENNLLENKNTKELSFEIDARNVEYIDETSIETLQKEVALNTQKEELKILKEKEKKGKIQDTQYSNYSKSDGLSFEMDSKEAVQPVDNVETSPVIDSSDSNAQRIRFELIQEEFSKSKPVVSQSEETAISVDLDKGKPIHFNKDDTFSFNEWLQLSSLTPIDRTSKEIVLRDKNRALIDEFIYTNPKIKPSKLAGFTVNFNQVEEIESDVVMTETLARVYTNQKKYNSAIKAYEVLSLKFPEKSSFFADQIKMLENLKQE